MFAKTIIDSDAFIEMPMSARLLYYDLSMRADDDGFVNSPKKIMRMIGASNDDMNILIARKFVIAFENGVVVIKHWRIHNYIKNDRYKETNYKEQKALLEYDENKAYRLMDTKCIQSGSSPDTQVRLEIELGKDSINSGNKTKRFVKPTIEELTAYCKEYCVDPERFYNYYEANGWKVGKNAMKDWKAAVRMWSRSNKQPDFKLSEKTSGNDIAAIRKRVGI